MMGWVVAAFLGGLIIGCVAGVVISYWLATSSPGFGSNA